MRGWIVSGVVAAGLALGGCGEEEVATTGSPAGAFSATSDVEQHAAIGLDVAAVRELLAPAESGDEAGFVGARKLWSEGQHSTKDDGTKRTLAGFVEGTAVAKRVGDALAGIGEATDLSPAERRQWVDKGMTVALALKVLSELDSAAEKAEAGDTDAAEGAPHNVDEAWAFFLAEGEGLALTATKRAADYDLPETELGDPVLAGLRAAKAAAVDGDADGIRAAQDDVRGALSRIFALAVGKYAVEGAEDPVARQEGAAFAWFLTEQLPAADATALTAALESSPDTVTVFLDGKRDALDIEGELPAYTP